MQVFESRDKNVWFIFLKKGSRNWVLPFYYKKTKITITTGAMSLYQQIIVNKGEGNKLLLHTEALSNHGPIKNVLYTVAFKFWGQ